MNKNKRLEKLTGKYREGSLTKAEYEDFIQMLKASENLGELDGLLDDYWHEMSQEYGDGDSVLSTGTVRFLTPKKKRRLVGWSIAASFLILMSAVYYLVKPFSEPYTTYATSFGEVLDVRLPDGSLVTLNANSTLTWSNKWEKRGSRAITLEGEAFFDIKNLDGMAFMVNTGDLSVEVVGTSFNVDSRKRKTEVYLDEGKVKLHVERDLGNTIVMEPGDKIKYDASQRKIEKTENESMISSASWKKGVLNFKDLAFSEVLDKLGVIYGKTFTCEDQDLLSKHIYLGVPYADWEAVRQALELSLNIRIVESQNTYIIQNE